MSKWTHAICENCWNKRNPDRPAAAISEMYRDLEICCFCGCPTGNGIYIIADPSTTPFCEHDKEESEA